MNVIAVMGKSKSGKDAIGDMIAEALPSRVGKVAFADKPKQVMMDLYGLTYDDLYTDEGKSRVTDFDCWKCPACSSIECVEEMVGREQKILCKGCTAIGDKNAFQTKWTVRMMMQFFMTEYAQRIDPLVWVKPTLLMASQHLVKHEPGSGMLVHGQFVGNKDLVVITDCRFRREAEAVWKAGGEVWRVRRPSTDRASVGLPGHASESQMDTIPDSMFQTVISNDGTLDLLRERVKTGLARFCDVRRVG